MEGENKKLLNFKGAVLYMSDREILKSPCYINDQIIEFYFRFLRFTYETQDILIVSPAVSFLLANSDDAGIRYIAESLKLEEKTLIFFTINNSLNNQYTEEESTTHWSLLVYYKKFHAFLHHDSIKGLNNPHAKKLYNTIKNFVGDDDDDDDKLPLILTCPNKIRKINNFSKASTKELNDDGHALYVEFFTPQQTNVYDCGLYVMKIAAVICEWYMSRKASDKSSLWYEFVRNKAPRWYVENNMRSDLLEFVDLLVDNECDIS